MKPIKLLAVLLCAAATLTACDKNAVQDITTPAPSARIRFFNFGVNAPGVNFYANDTKMTAISSVTGTEAVTGVAYGSVGSAGLYAGIEPGQYTVSGRIAAATDKDLPISDVVASIQPGKHYSVFLSGLYNTTTKKVDSFVVEDAFPASIDYSTAHVRFVNGIFNATPMTLYARNTTTGAEIAIGGPVAYKGGGEFVAVPNGVYDISTRVAGSTTGVIVRAAVSFSSGRVYTIASRGDMTVPGTTATNRPFLDNTANR
ncbi:MAG TPA: DUF4397 domain-containing protein [Longimicrobium sp.]|jgi:hypothetical protein